MFPGKTDEMGGSISGFFFGAGVHLPLFLAGGWFGFSFGMVMGISVLKFGFLGVGTGLLLVLPQGIFYAAGALVMLQGLAEWKWSFNRWNGFPGKEADGQYGSFLFGYFDGKLSESMESAPSFFVPVKEKRKI